MENKKEKERGRKRRKRRRIRFNPSLTLNKHNDTEVGNENIKSCGQAQIYLLWTGTLVFCSSRNCPNEKG